MKENMEVFDLYSFKFAKRVTEDIPDILIELSKFRDSLLKYNEYRDVSDVIIAITEAELILNIHYLKYKKVVDSKGKINASKN